MSVRILVPAAAVVALAIAAPAAAQSTTWSTSDRSMTVTLPAIMAPHPLGAERDGKGIFVVRRAGVDVGTCIASLMTPETAPARDVWKAVIATYTSDPEGSARTATEKSGNTFVRLLGSRSYQSPTGWDGYVYWFERNNTKSGQLQTAVNAGTMLDATHRFVAVCASTAGFTFQPAEIQSIVGFITSARGA
ncbi:MAG: hypothetical protein GC145_01715 [Caulobacter sp.]|nr:hypothetical protein [Caulobacter sp.]